MFFHLVPIAREKVINPTGVGGGRMSNVTNAVNWDMWKRYANLKILNKMFRLWRINQMRINQRRIYFLQVTTNESTKDWIIDSGCINHITHDREIFKELNKSNISKVRIENGEQLAMKSSGTISIKTHSGIKLILDVLYVPEITHNLLSVAQLLEKG